MLCIKFQGSDQRFRLTGVIWKFFEKDFFWKPYLAAGWLFLPFVGGGTLIGCFAAAVTYVKWFYGILRSDMPMLRSGGGKATNQSAAADKGEDLGQNQNKTLTMSF